MDFSRTVLDEETERFWAEVRALLAEHLTPEVREEEWCTGAGHAPGLHRALGERGWLFPGWPSEEGGAELDPLRIAILEREMTDQEVPGTGRGTTSLVVGALKRWLSEELRAQMAGSPVGLFTLYQAL